VPQTEAGSTPPVKLIKTPSAKPESMTKLPKMKNWSVCACAVAGPKTTAPANARVRAFERSFMIDALPPGARASTTAGLRNDKQKPNAVQTVDDIPVRRDLKLVKAEPQAKIDRTAHPKARITARSARTA